MDDQKSFISSKLEKYFSSSQHIINNLMQIVKTYAGLEKVSIKFLSYIDCNIWKKISYSIF